MAAGLPSMGDLARGLAHATPRTLTAGSHNPVLVNEQLRISLRRSIGANGYAVLLRRTLALVVATNPVLHGAIVGADGVIEQVDPRLLDDEALWREAIVAVTTQLIELLAVFLGESLTRRIVREACLHMSPSQPAPSPALPA